MKAVVFDLDGTLVDSAPDLHAATARLLDTLGKEPLPLDTIRSFIGNGIPKLVERVMRAAEIDEAEHPFEALVAKFTAEYEKSPSALTKLFPGVYEALELLRRRGYTLGVCTNKDENISRAILKDLHVAHFFSVVVGGDTLPVRKPDPAMLKECIKVLGADSTVYVGDSEIDSATAVAASVPFALYTCGYRKSPVSEIPHRTRFSTYRDLAGFLSTVGERSVRL